MPIYKAPVDDALFLLNDVFHLDHYGNLPGFSDASPDVVEAVLREAAKFSEEVLTPLNRVGDKEGCKRGADGSVTTPKGFKEAYGQIVEGGWIGISVPPEFGGQGLPATLTELVNEFFCSANMAFSTYLGALGAIPALLAHASDEIKRKYLPKMVEGVWTGIAYSITSSARLCTDCGTAMPSALAAFRLTISSNFVVCWTGRSAGLSPLRIFPA